MEARAIGADAVLLIVAILDRQSLRELAGLAHKLDLSVLIEVHDEAELEEALCLDEAIIGINNRDLRSFEVSLQTSIRLRRLIPENRLVVAESGIHTPEDIRILRQNDLHAFLIGESLMKAESPTEKLKELLAVNLY